MSYDPNYGMWASNPSAGAPGGGWPPVAAAQQQQPQQQQPQQQPQQASPFAAAPMYAGQPQNPAAYAQPQVFYAQQQQPVYYQPAPQQQQYVQYVAAAPPGAAYAAAPQYAAPPAGYAYAAAPPPQMQHHVVAPPQMAPPPAYHQQQQPQGGGAVAAAAQQPHWAQRRSGPPTAAAPGYGAPPAFQHHQQQQQQHPYAGGNAAVMPAAAAGTGMYMPHHQQHAVHAQQQPQQPTAAHHHYATAHHHHAVQQHQQQQQQQQAAAAAATPTPALSSDAPMQLAAMAHVTSKTQPHCIAVLAASEAFLKDKQVFDQFYTLCKSREFGAWLHVSDGNPSLTREQLADRIASEFGSRLLFVISQWGSKQPAKFTGVVTCGPKSLGPNHWRLGAFFDAQHKVPLTLCILQLAIRFWYALDQKWPTQVEWRMPHGSIESRRIAETALIFHAKQNDPAAQSPNSPHPPATNGSPDQLFQTITLRSGSVPFKSSARDPKATPDPENAHAGEYFDLALGSASAAHSFLLDLATWGVGTARWAFYEAGTQPPLFAAAFPIPWRGHVLHAANLPLACRGFQHLPPAGRSAVLGQTLYDILGCVAVNVGPLDTDDSRAAASDTNNPGSPTESPPPQSVSVPPQSSQGGLDNVGVLGLSAASHDTVVHSPAAASEGAAVAKNVEQPFKADNSVDGDRQQQQQELTTAVA